MCAQAMGVVQLPNARIDKAGDRSWLLPSSIADLHHHLACAHEFPPQRKGIGKKRNGDCDRESW
jgi:hypothetical protein